MKYPLRALVFWPTFLILLAAVIASYIDLQAFLAVSKQLNGVILNNFSWLFSAGSFAMVVLRRWCIAPRWARCVSAVKTRGRC